MDEEIKTDVGTVTIEMAAEEIKPENKTNEPQVAVPSPSNPQTNQPQKEELSTNNTQIKTIKCTTNDCNKVFNDVKTFEQHVIETHLGGGRPCEFCLRKEEILKLTQEYILSGKSEKPRMLYINELAMNLGVYRDIVTDWKNKTKADGSLEHPQFHRMIKELESMQELRLNQRLLGRYNPTGAIFLLKTKHKYIETEKQILAGDKNEPIEITITEEDRKKDHTEGT